MADWPEAHPFQPNELFNMLKSLLGTDYRGAGRNIL
jgi:hypothetical protein